MSLRSRPKIAQDSRGDRGFRGVGRALPIASGGLALVGVLLLGVAEFLPLLEVRLGSSGALLKTISTGTNNNYSLLLIAIAAIPFALTVLRARSRGALVALAILGLVAAAIAFLGDLPDAHSTGIYGKNFEDAAASAQAGFYLESLGAILLILAAALGLLLSAPTGGGRQNAPADAVPTDA